jgi:predicted AAA+ superfamily ATPase
MPPKKQNANALFAETTSLLLTWLFFPILQFSRGHFVLKEKVAMKRYCEDYIYEDLKKKMVFISGPRQVGKTTLSKALCHERFSKGVCFNWDLDEDRRTIIKKQWLSTTPLIIFDELHKYPRWKQWIKGVYDTKPPHQQYLLTGSARLNVYRRGGDSLMGRYHNWRLHPLTIDELPPHISSEEGLRRLLSLGGFPEPFLMNDEREARRWRDERFDRVLREDVRDLESIRNIQLLALFVDALRERVGNLITLSNLASDLQISPKTAKNWLSLVEHMFIAFPIYPLTKNVPRAIQKPPKVYFYDNADVLNDGGARLENLVATTLIKRLHFLKDYHGYRCNLYYLRDKEGREVDFVTEIEGKIIDLIEVKTTDTQVSSSLKYYAERLKPKNAVQIVGELKRPFHKDNILVTNPIDFFKDPPWR